MAILAVLLMPPSPPRPKVDVQSVALRPLTDAEWNQNRGVDGPAPASSEDKARREREQVASRDREEEPPKEKKKREEKPDGQVVDIGRGNDQEDPNAKYLAESSNKVQRETKAKNTTPFYRNAAPQKTAPVEQKAAGSDDVAVAQKQGNNGEGDEDRPIRPEAQQQLAMEIPDIKSREEVKLEQDPDKTGPGPSVSNRTESAEVKGNSNRLRLQDGVPAQEEDGSRGRAGSGIANLLPSMTVLDKVYGAAPNQHLEDVEEGNGTYLNTREWKYSSFFNRVRQGIGLNWDPGSELRVRDPTGRMYGGRDRHTVLQVTLDEHGRVKQVFVSKSCGLDFLDLEAMNAFERAQPFPNPPPALLDENATITFNFGFFVEMSGGGAGVGLFR